MTPKPFLWGAPTLPKRARGTSTRSANSARSAAARASGGEFEAELQATHDLLAARGVPVVMSRGHPPVSGNPKTGLYYSGQGTVDFVGRLGGLPVAFDAKSEAGAASYKHDPDDNHELTFLLRFRGQGYGVAFLLIRDAELGRAYLVTDLDALLRGESVALRAHARHGAAPVVPCIEDAGGKCRWDWTALVGTLTSEGR